MPDLIITVGELMQVLPSFSDKKLRITDPCNICGGVTVFEVTNDENLHTLSPETGAELIRRVSRLRKVAAARRVLHSIEVELSEGSDLTCQQVGSIYYAVLTVHTKSFGRRALPITRRHYGVARCSDSDENIPIVGEAIAKARAMYSRCYSRFGKDWYTLLH